MGNIPNLPKISKKTPENEKSKMFHFFWKFLAFAGFTKMFHFFWKFWDFRCKLFKESRYTRKKCLHSKKIRGFPVFPWALGIWVFLLPSSE